MRDTESGLGPAYNTFLLSQKAHGRIIGVFIGLLMMVVYLWMAYGLFNLLLGLYHSFSGHWLEGAEDMIKDVVLILAFFELIRVFQSYLILGRVRVTFILDVALVVLIGELISLWYAEYEPREVIMSMVVISSLVILRILTTRFSPDCSDT